MTVKQYVDWLKNNWAPICLILAFYIILFSLVFVKPYSMVVFIIMLNVPFYLLHQTEEYIFPGGFQKFFNHKIFKVNEDNAPMNTNFIFYVNTLLIWVLLPLFAFLSVLEPTLGLWISYFSIFAGLGHVALGIKGKVKYNPGLIVSLLLNIPYGIYAVHYLTSEGLIANPWFNIHLLIGLLLNLMLPIMGVILYKRYQKSLVK